MKKLISIVASFSIAFSMIFSVSAAEFNPTADVSATIMTNDEFKAIADSDIPSGYTMYKLSVDLSKIGELTYYKEGLKYSGRKLDTAQLDLFDLLTYVDADYTMMLSNCFESSSVTEGFDGTNYFAGYSTAAVASAYPLVAGESTDVVTAIDDVYTVLVGVPSAEPFTVNYQFKYCFTVYSKGTPSADDADIQKGSITGTVTFGTATTGDVTKIDADEQTVGVQADQSVKTYESTDGTQKYLKHIATVLDGAAANKTVTINKVDAQGNVLDSKVSGRTLAQIFYGVTTENTTISGKLAIGVLTSNVDDIFEFVLVDAE